MKDRPTECVKCSTVLQGPGSRGGRPSRFCSEGCKVGAEAEIRRLNVVLRKFEEDRAREPLQWREGADPARVARELARRDEAIADLQARFDRPGRLRTGGGA
jgi:hypothetical protein